MSKTLNSIAFNSPASPQSLALNATFSFAGTPGFTGTGGVNRYDFKWEVDPGTGYVTIGAATGLTTGGTNPVTNSNSSAQQSITVTCSSAGSYTIRMSGAPATGGAYTVTSSTQTVTVTAPIVVTPGKLSLTKTGLAPTVTATQNALARPGVLTLSLARFAPTVTASDHKTAAPDTASLSLTGLAPTVTVAAAAITVTPDTASLTISTLAPTVTATANQLATPAPASLTITTYAPTVTGSIVSEPEMQPAPQRPARGGPGAMEHAMLQLGRSIKEDEELLAMLAAVMPIIESQIGARL